jgi:hypothetical protein
MCVRVCGYYHIMVSFPPRGCDLVKIVCKLYKISIWFGVRRKGWCVVCGVGWGGVVSKGSGHLDLHLFI